MANFREEKDTMGIVRVPENAHYGAQTQRAVENIAIGSAGQSRKTGVFAIGFMIAKKPRNTEAVWPIRSFMQFPRSAAPSSVLASILAAACS